MRLNGNTIFITGGGSGIGRGFAEAFHKLGNKVIIAGRRCGRLDAVVAANPEMAALELDIAVPTSIDSVARVLFREYPDVNVLINSAAKCQSGTAVSKPSAPRSLRPATAWALRRPSRAPPGGTAQRILRLCAPCR
jgi:uncharacterized oxidoreductase